MHISYNSGFSCIYSMHDKRVIPLYTDHSGFEEHIYLPVLACIMIFQY